MVIFWCWVDTSCFGVVCFLFGCGFGLWLGRQLLKKESVRDVLGSNDSSDCGGV